MAGRTTTGRRTLIGHQIASGTAARATGGLPRSQAGTTPQHLLMTLLGDYWLGQTQHLPSAVLVDLLAEFAITKPSARIALNRLTKRGLLVTSKRGRNTYYGPSAPAAALVRETLKRIVAFGAREVRTWDGTWTMVPLSVPETRRRLRHSIRTSLRGWDSPRSTTACGVLPGLKTILARSCCLTWACARRPSCEPDRPTQQRARIVVSGSGGRLAAIPGVRGGVLPDARRRAARRTDGVTGARRAHQGDGCLAQVSGDRARPAGAAAPRRLAAHPDARVVPRALRPPGSGRASAVPADRGAALTRACRPGDASLCERAVV